MTSLSSGPKPTLIIKNNTDATLNFSAFQPVDPSPNATTEYRWDITSELFQNVTRLTIEVKTSSSANFALLQANVATNDLQGVLNALNAFGIGIFYSVTESGSTYIKVPSNTFVYGTLDIISPGFPIGLKYAFLSMLAPLQVMNPAGAASPQTQPLGGFYQAFGIIYGIKSDGTYPTNYRVTFISGSGFFPNVVVTGAFTPLTPNRIQRQFPPSDIGVYTTVRLEFSDGGDYEEACTIPLLNGATYPDFAGLTYNSVTGAASINLTPVGVGFKGGDDPLFTMQVRALPFKTQFPGQLPTSGGPLLSAVVQADAFNGVSRTASGVIETGLTASDIKMMSNYIATMPDGTIINEAQAYPATQKPYRSSPLT